TEDGRTYGRLKLTPTAKLSVTLKGGAAHRQARGIDLSLLPVNENPLIAIYNLSNRDRDFFELDSTWAPTEKVSIALQGLFANDEYRRSQLGLLSGTERRLGATASWAPKPSLSFYGDGGYQVRKTLQAGEFSSASSLWQAAVEDRYWNAGAGVHYVRKAWELNLDYAHAMSAGDTGVGAVGVLAAFPQLRTRYDNASATLGYNVSKALKLRLRYAYQNYVTDDWALDNVGPATVTNLLSLGAPAGTYNVNLVSLSFTYKFGKTETTAKAGEE
ncbi:MAG: MtrB/PioB family outer membrane beta-barrel protein, partial [Proteobacteria bacterium]|nr:MtrB/PioB family outer membrane beta-barrel protein [Pseudomonadota bacterium]